MLTGSWLLAIVTLVASAIVFFKQPENANAVEIAENGAPGVRGVVGMYGLALLALLFLGNSIYWTIAIWVFNRRNDYMYVDYPLENEKDDN